MTDDNDKTVFIRPGAVPPLGAEERTIMVPNPGARPTPNAAANRTATAQMNALVTPTPNEKIVVHSGLNPIVTAASVILTVSNRLRSTLEHPDVQGLQQQLINELKQFEQAGENQQIPPEQLLSARYILCTMLDEIALNTPWGASSHWSQFTLLSRFHNETSGGEKCFVLLQRMLEAPAQHLDVLELFYLCFSLGFQGKYKLDPMGRDKIERINNTLFQTIKNYRKDFEPDLSPSWISQAAKQRSLMQYVPVWIVASCTLLVLLVIFSGFKLWLYQTTEPVTQRLHNLTEFHQSAVQTPSTQDQ